MLQRTVNTHTLFRSTRPSFLVLTPACVVLGIAAAFYAGHAINITDVLVILIGALAAHISVNTLNEYHDFQSGLDTRTQRTPFSGGSGALVEHPNATNLVKLTAYFCLGITVLIGFYFVYRHGGIILPFGLLGTLIILTYTPVLNRYPVLCLLAPGVGFGPLMVGGTYVILSGSYNGTAFIISLVPLFLVSNLLLLNQFPDIEADKTVGRYHFPIAYGVKPSILVYGLFALLAAAIIILGVVMKLFPIISLAALLPLMAAFSAFSGARKYEGEIEKLMPGLAMNVFAAIATPVILAITLFLN